MNNLWDQTYIRVWTELCEVDRLKRCYLRTRKRYQSYNWMSGFVSAELLSVLILIFLKYGTDLNIDTAWLWPLVAILLVMAGIGEALAVKFKPSASVSVISVAIKSCNSLSKQLEQLYYDMHAGEVDEYEADSTLKLLITSRELTVDQVIASAEINFSASLVASTQKESDEYMLEWHRQQHPDLV